MLWSFLFCLCGAVDDSATESEGDGNAREVTVATVAPPATRAPKIEKEPRAKGVLKRRSVNHESHVKNEATPPPDHHPVVEVQQPKGELLLLNDLVFIVMRLMFSICSRKLLLAVGLSFKNCFGGGVCSW